MIEQRRLFILGNTLLVEGLVHLLMSNQHVTIVGSSHALDEVLPYLNEGQLDMLVVAGLKAFIDEMADRLFANYANLSVLLVYPDRAYMELHSVQRVSARYADLMAVIDGMP